MEEDEAQTELVAAWMRGAAGAEHALVQRFYPGVRRFFDLRCANAADDLTHLPLDEGPTCSASVLGRRKTVSSHKQRLPIHGNFRKRHHTTGRENTDPMAISGA